MEDQCVADAKSRRAKASIATTSDRLLRSWAQTLPCLELMGPPRVMTYTAFALRCPMHLLPPARDTFVPTGKWLFILQLAPEPDLYG